MTNSGVQVSFESSFPSFCCTLYATKAGKEPENEAIENQQTTCSVLASFPGLPPPPVFDRLK